MSTREMICDLINYKVPATDLELLYQLILKFIPADTATPDELEALAETAKETEFISHDSINWD
ncbi:MAG TPA: hypothetical protein DIW26_09090 [Ruminococcus sp.]|nr:hypothetical protein [Ruminococcus sp.]HCR74491.1 hypothetical protein [Ruminococcus sp.]